MVATDEPEVIVPLVAPSPEQLRAGAVWVTISNWADALSQRYGAAEIVTPASIMTPADARHGAFQTQGPGSPQPQTNPNSPASGPSARSRSGLLLRTGAKDVRWAMWAQHASRRIRRLEVSRYRSTPYVWQHHDLFERPGFGLARTLDVPLVLFVDAPQVWEARRWGVSRPGWGRVVERIGETPQFCQADLVACVSSEVAEEVSRLSAGRARVLVTPCTSPIPPTDERDEVRRSLGLDGQLVIGWVGSFRRFHHADMVVRAANELSAHRSDVVLLMVGDGPTRADCQQLAADLGLTALFTGTVQNDQVPGLLQACDIGVVPAASGDSFHYSPLKLKEYLAAGLATVVPSSGEMARLFDDGVETLMFPAGDLNAMTAQLSRLAEDPGLRSAVAVAGSARLSESFSMPSQLEAVEIELGLQQQSRPAT